jgi:hypothetical protein
MEESGVNGPVNGIGATTKDFGIADEPGSLIAADHSPPDSGIVGSPLCFATELSIHLPAAAFFLAMPTGYVGLSGIGNGSGRRARRRALPPAKRCGIAACGRQPAIAKLSVSLTISIGNAQEGGDRRHPGAAATAILTPRRRSRFRCGL